MKLKLLFLMVVLCGCTLSAFSQSQTSDQIVVSAVQDSEGNSVSAIPVDGSVCTLSFSLVGGQDDANRLYTAYNLDVQLPLGMEVCHEEGVPMVGLPSDFSLYAAGISSLTHSLSATVLGDGKVRIACFSGRNANFSKTSGALFQMMVRISSPYASPGTHQIHLTGQNLTVKENAQKFVPSDRTETITIAEGETSVQLVIPAETGYSTCVLPFDAPLPDGVKAFSCNSHADETVYLERVTSLQAYTPYILYAATGYSGKLSGTLSATAYASSVTDGIVRNGYLCGAISPQTITSGFVLQHLEEGLKFYFTAGETFLIPSGKCWLELSKSNARALTFKITDPETGLTLPVAVGKDADFYDLSGRRIENPAKGVYIQKNRKFIK